MSPNELLRRLKFWLKREEVTRELEEEMRFHVEMRAERLREAPRDRTRVLVEPRARIRHDAAHTAARQRFGNTTTLQQRSRDMWGFGRLEDLRSDVRFAFRRLALRPAFTAAVVGVMAIGIGATTAMFSAVDAALLRPLPFRDPEQLAVLHVSIRFDDPAEKTSSRDRNFYSTDVDSMKTTFSDVASYGSGAFDLADPEHPLHLNVGVVTTNFFQTLGVQPLVGRAFVAGEGKDGSRKVVILSHGLWQREYGARDIKGLKVTLAQELYDVVGVMPAGFSFPRESDVWIPMAIPHTMATLRPFVGGSINSTTLGRLRPGISVADASARLMARWQQIRNAQPASGEDYVTKGLIESGPAVPLQQALVGDRKTALLVLLGATGLLLLVACVNVTNLLLSHAQARAREISVRQVLGATRTRIVRQLLTESVVLSLGGAILGTLLAPFALGMITVLMPKSLAGLSPAHIDLRILAFAALLALITGVAFGLWPALGSARRDNSDVIKSGGGHGSTSARGGRARRLLVGAELALTTALLIGAGLMLQSFRQVMSRGTGMLPPHVGTMQLSFPRTAGREADRKRRMEEILNRFAGMSDIAAAGFVNDLPLGSDSKMSLRLDIKGAVPLTTSKDPLSVMTRWISATGGYFPAMGIKLLRGRLFTERDGPNAPKVAIISERMARTYWPGQEALGRTFTMPLMNVPTTIVGIVADVRDYKLEQDPQMQLYQSAYAVTPTTAALVVRSDLPERELLARMQAVVRVVDPAQAVFALRMMDDVVDISVAPRRTNTVLITAFALVALALASVGIYAVVSYGVSHRSRELGIRSALGASGSNLLQMISQEMVWVVVLGIAAGLGGAWALAKTLESLVYGVSVHDPVTFIVVPLVLMIPVIVATILPARRVLWVDPSVVMRAD